MNWKDCRRKPLGPNLKYGQSNVQTVLTFREVQRKPKFAQVRTRYTTVKCICTETDTLASTKVRRISGFEVGKFSPLDSKVDPKALWSRAGQRQSNNRYSQKTTLV
jgi:hypothetical protein